MNIVDMKSLFVRFLLKTENINLFDDIFNINSNFNYYDKNGNDLIMCAYRSNLRTLVIYLLNKIKNIKIRNNNGENILLLAYKEMILK